MSETENDGKGISPCPKTHIQIFFAGMERFLILRGLSPAEFQSKEISRLDTFAASPLGNLAWRVNTRDQNSGFKIPKLTSGTEQGAPDGPDY